jgi:hypothetical protein
MEEAEKSHYTKIPHRKSYAILSPAEALLCQPWHSANSPSSNFSFMEKFIATSGESAPTAKNLYLQLVNY